MDDGETGVLVSVTDFTTEFFCGFKGKVVITDFSDFDQSRLNLGQPIPCSNLIDFVFPSFFFLPSGTEILALVPSPSLPTYLPHWMDEWMGMTLLLADSVYSTLAPTYVSFTWSNDESYRDPSTVNHHYDDTQDNTLAQER